MARWLLIIVFLVSSAINRADACSCMPDSRALNEQLVEQLNDASDVYRARIIETSGRRCASLTTIEVLEVFKGTTKAGERFDLPSGGCGDCTLGFRPTEHWIIYGFGTPGYVGMCTRSHPIRDGDVEIAWLRSKLLPPEPVALQREVVGCGPCNLRVVTESLLGGTQGSCNSSLEDDEATRAYSRVLRCSPLHEIGSRYRCQVVTGPDLDVRPRSYDVPP